MFDFDPRLSALPLAFDLDAVAQLLEQHWPGRRMDTHAPVTIRQCHVQDTKYQPLASCVITYGLVVEQPGVTSWPTIGVVQICPEGVKHRLFDADPQLPWLALAGDPEEMRRRFAAWLEGVGHAPEIEACSITPIRYKPGLRCALRYDLHTQSGRRIFFGKLVEHSDELMTTVTALHRASWEMPEMPRVAQPVAYCPETHLVIQSAIANGTELHNHVFDVSIDDTVRAQWMRAAGACAAALHSYKGTIRSRRTFEDDLHELYGYRAPMAQVSPRLAVRFEETISHIAELARSRAETTPAASHGALRTDQFMIENGCLVLIDLDGFCWANPARDVGNLLAYLQWKAIRQPEHATFIERAAQAFYDGYTAARPALDANWLKLYQAASMLKIAGRRFRSLTYREWPLVPRLLDAAQVQASMQGEWL